MAVFRVKDKRTRRAAHEMIVDMAKHASGEFERAYGYRFRTEGDVYLPDIEFVGVLK